MISGFSVRRRNDLGVGRRWSDAALGVLLLSLWVSLIACAGSGESAAPSAVAEEGFKGVEVVETTVLDNEEDLLGEPVDPESPRRGGVLLIEVEECGIADPTIDVAISRTFDGFTLVREIHAGLMKVADNQTSRTEPELAESFKVREGGLLYEFVLKKDLKFSDGSPLTASDVKWSWERALRKSTGNSRANDILGGIEGSEAVADGTSQDLIGVEVVDDRQLNVRIVAPRPEFPMLLTDPVAYVLKDEDVEEWGDAWVNDFVFPGETTINTGIVPRSLPTGAGPFRVVEYAHPETTREGGLDGARCVLERNDHYWDRLAYLDGIIAIVRPDIYWNFEATEARQKELLDSGKLDFMTFIAGGIDDVQGGFTKLRMDQPPNIEFITLNPSQPPLDDVHFRRALARAIDVVAVIRNLNGDPNQSRLVPQSLSFEGSTVSVLDFDLEAAHNELGMSRHSTNISDFDFLLYSISSPESFGLHQQAIFNAWSESLGLNVEILQFDFEEEIRLVDVQMTRVRFTPSYPSPHGVLRELANALGENNSSDEVIEMKRTITNAASTLDNAERLRKYAEIEQHILDDALAIPFMVFDPHLDILTQPWVQGLSLQAYGNSVFRDVWLDEEAPERLLR